MIEEMILKILAQESLDLDLWMERYEGSKFRGLFYKFSEARDLSGFSNPHICSRAILQGLPRPRLRGVPVFPSRAARQVPLTILRPLLSCHSVKVELHDRSQCYTNLLGNTRIDYLSLITHVE
jgi:hypothetical protein